MVARQRRTDGGPLFKKEKGAPAALAHAFAS
jgi:hypothetical protein